LARAGDGRSDAFDARKGTLKMGSVIRRAGLLPIVAVALLLAVPCAAPAAEGDDEAAIRRIVSDEIVQGLLRKSPDLYLRSYLPEAAVFSYVKGKVDVARYKAILADYFERTSPGEVKYEVLHVRIEGTSARMAVTYAENGKTSEGTGYRESFKRYYFLIKEGGTWRIKTDGYNETLMEIKRYH
jgi:hypothetical protein